MKNQISWPIVIGRLGYVCQRACTRQKRSAYNSSRKYTWTGRGRLFLHIRYSRTMLLLLVYGIVHNFQNHPFFHVGTSTKSHISFVCTTNWWEASSATPARPACRSARVELHAPPEVSWVAQNPAKPGVSELASGSAVDPIRADSAELWETELAACHCTHNSIQVNWKVG